MSRSVALLVAALALAVAGCGSSDKSNEQTAATPTATSTPASTQTPAATPTETATEDKDKGEEEDNAKAADKDCDSVKGLDGTPKDQPPADVRILDSAKLYKSQGPFGKTEIFYASAEGDPDSLPAVRDDAANMLVQDSAYQILSTDQEEGSEAEAHLKGDQHTVELQVIPLCKGKLRLRYTVE